MKILIVIAFAGMILAGYLGFKTLTLGIQNRIGSMQNSEVLARDLQKELATPEGCFKVFAATVFDVAALARPQGKMPVAVTLGEDELRAGSQLAKQNVSIEDLYLTNLVDLSGAEGEPKTFQARMKMKVTAIAREHVIGLIRISLDDQNKIARCATAGMDSTSPCQADNSPDQMRAGGAANIVSAPEGTTAISGKLAKPVFGFKGVVKWLPTPACGPVNLCQDGLWTTTSIIPCKD